MSTPEHLAGYAAISDAFFAATGKQLASFVVVGVAADGEVYAGAKAARGDNHAALLGAIEARAQFVKSQRTKVAA